MLLSRRAPGVFDACEAAPPPSAEASGSSPSTAAVTGEEGLGELARPTVLWAAGTECPLRRCRFPRHLPPEAVCRLRSAEAPLPVATVRRRFAALAVAGAAETAASSDVFRIEHLNLGVAFGDSSLPDCGPDPPVP